MRSEVEKDERKGNNSLDSEHFQRVSHVSSKLLPPIFAILLPVLTDLELLVPFLIPPKDRPEPLLPFPLVLVLVSLVVARRSTEVDGFPGRRWFGCRRRQRGAPLGLWGRRRGGRGGGEVAIVIEVLDSESSKIRRDRFGGVEEKEIYKKGKIEGQ